MIFTGNLWIGGFDDGGNLKLAAKTYGQGDNNGYWPGPLNENGSIQMEDCANWDRLFKVSKMEIEAFLMDFNDNGQLDDPVPASVLGWPGRDNPSFSLIHGFELPNTSGGFAPFFDINFNGIYEPMMGDYPEIKCADQAIWWVFNDRGNTNLINASTISMEIQMMAYAYDTNLSNIYNASFYDVKVINKGTEPLDSMYIGIWIDPDLGCEIDDYLGCDPDENLVYVYNEDALDGQAEGLCGGTKTYLEEPPIYGVKLIKKPLSEFGEDIDMSSFNFYDNQSVIPSEPLSPTTAWQYYNILTGNRYDGAPFQNPSGEVTKYLYSDSPDEEDGWSMCSEDLGGGDRRFVMSVGPMRLMPGAYNDMTFAVVVQPQPQLPCPNLDDFIIAADLPGYSISNNQYCNLTVGTTEENLEKNNILVFPNPATNQINFQLPATESFLSLQLYRMDGQLVIALEDLQSSNYTLNRNELAAGMYVYQMQTHSGIYKNGKIILK